jgi:hypothetical protein
MAIVRAAPTGLLFAAFALGAVALAGCGHDDTRAAMTLTEAPAYGLFFNDTGETASLAYGEAQSDNVSLMLECEKGSGRVQVSDIARGAGPARLVLASGRRTSELGGKLEASDGPAVLVAEAPLAADALQGFRRTGKLTVTQGEARYGVAASGPERDEVQLFFTACATAT